MAIMMICVLTLLSSSWTRCSAFSSHATGLKCSFRRLGVTSSSVSVPFPPRPSFLLAIPNDNEENDSWESSSSSRPGDSTMIGGAGVSNAGEPPFEIRGFSLGNLVIVLGILVTVGSFAGYLTGDGGDGGVSGLGFVYGLPIFLAGAALKYAEIKPVPCLTEPAAEGVMEQKGTEILQKIKKDVTRHRYGDEAHLDTTVKRLGLVVPGRAYPQLKEIRERLDDQGRLVFTLVWESLETPFKLWNDEARIARYGGYFGGGLDAAVIKVDAEKKWVAIELTVI